MKLAVIFGVTFFMALSAFARFYPNHTRGCYYVDGQCVKECEEGTHSYAVGCSEVLTEPTCEQPTPQSMGVLCDYSSCYCDEPTVRHTASKTCVKLEDCDKAQ